jgi:protein-S-isoprenylcysteine O-methyltransferase Ste14
MKQDQSLEIGGPYKWVRHPMYTILFLLGIAYFFISANWLIAAVWIGWIAGTVASMLRDEEAALIERFGEEYRTYMRRTGRYLPRLSGGIR